MTVRILRAPLARALATLACATALLAGCAPRPEVLAKVGDEIITTDQFLDAARSSAMQYPGVPDSAKAMLLNDLVQRALLVQEARRIHLLPDTALARMQAQLGDQIAVETLVRGLAPRDVPVSDAEVAQMYAWRGTEAHVQVIYAPDRANADQALAAVRRGEDFGTIANRLNTLSMLPPGGDVGFLTPGSLVDPIDGAVRAARIGEVVGPLEVPGQGWFLVRVLARRARVQEPLATQDAQIRDMLRQRKQRVLAQRAFQDLREAYQVRVEPGGPQAMFMHFNSGAAPLVRGMGGETLPGDSPIDPRRVLGRYVDGKGTEHLYTLGDALAEMEVNAQERPDVTRLPILGQWIDQQLVRRVAAIEAGRRHLAEEPAVQRQVRERVNNTLLNAFYSSQILARSTQPSEADVRAAFERNANRFARIDAAVARVATTPDSATGAALVARGGEMRDAIAAVAPGTPFEERAIHYPTAEQPWALMQNLFMAMAPGEWRGPFRLPTGWVVLQLVSKQQGEQTFETLDPTVRQALANQALEMSRDRMLHEITERLRAKYRPEIHRDRLKALPWGLEAAAPPAG